MLNSFKNSKKLFKVSNFFKSKKKKDKLNNDLPVTSHIALKNNIKTIGIVKR